MESIFRSFPQILDQFENNQDAREAFVFAAWKKTVGDGMNSHTAAVEFQSERLRVAVSNLTWKVHLESMAPEILARLNRLLGKPTVKFIEFYIDETMEKERAADLQIEKRATAQESRIGKELMDAMASIGNENIRIALLRAAESCLERRERLDEGT